MSNGLHIVYSAVNQAWFVMWFNQVLYICTTKADAEYELARLSK